jgi:hypothetical protein
MSLINEALKRAKEAQNTAAPAPSLEFRPVDPAAANHRNQRLMLLVTMGVVVLLAILLIWQMSQTSRSSRQASAAERPVRNAPIAAKVDAPAPVVLTRDEAPAPKQAAQPEAAAVSSALPEVSKVAVSEPQVSTPAPEIVPPPKPAPRLQSIIYNPNRPSAMINGKFVLVGDKFGEWRVTRIDQDSATLVGNGLTNVLVLDP